MASTDTEDSVARCRELLNTMDRLLADSFNESLSRYNNLRSCLADAIDVLNVDCSDLLPGRPFHAASEFLAIYGGEAIRFNETLEASAIARKSGRYSSRHLRTLFVPLPISRRRVKRLASQLSRMTAVTRIALMMALVQEMQHPTMAKSLTVDPARLHAIVGRDQEANTGVRMVRSTCDTLPTYNPIRC